MIFSEQITPFMQLPREKYLTEVAQFDEFFGSVELFSSGRDALLRALKQASTAKSKIFIPDYFCPWIIKSIRESFGERLLLYADYPNNPTVDFNSLNPQPTDIVVAVNFFGTRDMQIWADWKISNSQVVLIGDFSHCPFSMQANCDIFDYVFASLRKTLPLCDGGYLRSKHHNPNKMFCNAGEISEFATNYALSSMLANVDYQSAENFYYNAEMRLNAKRNVSRISFYSKQMLAKLDFDTMWDARKKVFTTFENLLDKNRGFQILKNSKTFNSDNFSIFCPTLYFDDVSLRDIAYARLGEVGVLPSIYWSAKFLESEKAKAVASRMMTISVDFRHNESDAMKLADILNNI